jgi:ABC-type nitrate/sulfonate/bicarbonate transport system ATPase subunit
MITYKKEELILSVNDLSVKYGDKQILKDISFDIHNITRPNLTQGQIISICGRSGCGKTSLFKTISGFLKPTTGTIKIGVEQKDVIMGEVGVIQQDYPLFNHRTVYENLSLSLKNVKTDNEKKEKIHHYCDLFNLLEHLNKYPSQLSGGQRQRVSILQQVLTENKFILMDEPFSGLDVLMKDKVIELMLKVSNLDEMNTLIIVSHDIESSCAISDTVHILANKDNTGSTVVKSYDFLKENLAYRKDIKDDYNFKRIINEIKSLI